MANSATAVANRTDGRIGDGIRLDRTPGRFEIFVSPFKHAWEIAIRLNCTRGGIWDIEENHVGGHCCDVTQAVCRDTRETINLWMDSQGRWWIQKQLGTSLWLPDIDATEALVPRGDDVTSTSAEHIWNGQA